MTNQTHYPTTPEQFAANANAIKSLVASQTRGTDNLRTVKARFNAAQSAIARMQSYHDINPTSPVAPRIAQRIAEMKAELAAAVGLTPPTVSDNLLDPIETPAIK